MSVMRDEIYLGPVPAGEDCEQLGRNYDERRARAECKAYIGQIRRERGPEPEGARLVVKSNPHDFGTYLEVVCKYDSEDEAAVTYAFDCEAAGSAEWDEIARQELGLTERETVR